MQLWIGKDASEVGSISTLESTEYIIGHHRGHGLRKTKGADWNLMMADFYDKENGYCRGHSGSMYIVIVKGGNLGANGVVGGGVPQWIKI